MRRIERPRDERGAFIVLFALLLVALMIMVAIVIDLGAVRGQRRENQKVADVAALAAGASLSPVNGIDPVDACEDAWLYLQINMDDLPDSPAPSMPCSTQFSGFQTTPCTATSSEVNAVGVNTGRFRIVITYPVSDASIIRFGSIVPSDGTQCERMRVSVQEDVTARFARIIGVDTISPTMSAVVRGRADSVTSQFAALLLLERMDCAVFQADQNGGILVKKFTQDGKTFPGIIHADSDGKGSCSGGINNKSNYVVWGRTIPPGGSRPGEPSVIAEGLGPAACPKPVGAPTYLEGVLDLVAFPSARALHANQDPPAIAVCPGPKEQGIVSSRKPVDDRWNLARINGSRTAAQAMITSPPTPFRTFPNAALGETCANDSGPDIADSTVIVNCTNYQPNSRRFSGSTVIFNGSVQVGANGRLYLPNAKTVVIAGCGTCSGGGTPSWGFDISGNANTYVGINDGDAFTTPPTPPIDEVCDDRVATAPHNVTPARMVILSGPFTMGGNSNMALCQTFVHMASHSSPQQVVGSYHSTCTTEKPCAMSVTGPTAGHVRLLGAGITWTAPNQLCTPGTLVTCEGPPSATNPWEDLALWTEAGTGSSGSTDSQVGGGTGSMFISGRFFAPNATMLIGANTDLAQPFDAQFISRRLFLSGQGDLVMTPDPRNSVSNPTPAWSLIR